MPISTALNTAVSGLLTSQKAIDVISQNISNVNTEGYTKKIFNQKNVVVEGRGVGVTDTYYTRVVDEGLLSDLRANSGNLQNLYVKNDFMGRLQTLFGEPGSSSDLTNEISNIQTAMENLSANATDSAAQKSALAALSSAVSRINNLSSQIQQMRQEADSKIADLCDEVNDLLTEIDSLNSSILRTKTLNSQSTAEYEDQRDKALLRLSEVVDVQYFYRSTGEIVITTSTGETLLDEEPHKLSHSTVTVTDAFTSYASGNISGLMLDKLDITSSISGGELGAYLELRDGILPETQASLDELAATLTEKVNEVSNESTAFPYMTSMMTGSRTFINPNSQTVTISKGDVKIALFDSDGSQVCATSLKGGIGFATGSVTQLASEIQDWLRVDADGPLLPNASVYVNGEGKLFIDLGTSNYGIGFLDEAASSFGSTQEASTIAFDADGDGKTDTEVEGFSYFFGLNDAIKINTNDWAYDSNIYASNQRVSIGSTAVINFSIAGKEDMASVQILSGDTLQSVVDRINQNSTLKGFVNACLVQEGTGYRIRIENSTGEQMEITEATSTGVLNTLGIAPSNSGAASKMTLVAANINPGMMQFDSYSGEYFLSSSDNSAAFKYCNMLSKTQDFSQAGFMSSGGATFAQYASGFVSQVSTDTAAIESQYAYQSELTDTLSYKSSQISGVNLDEELASLTVYELSYSAAARIISVSTEMLDDLFAIV